MGCIEVSANTRSAKTVAKSSQAPSTLSTNGYSWQDSLVIPQTELLARGTARRKYLLRMLVQRRIQSQERRRRFEERKILDEARRKAESQDGSGNVKENVVVGSERENTSESKENLHVLERPCRRIWEIIEREAAGKKIGQKQIAKKNLAGKKNAGKMVVKDMVAEKTVTGSSTASSSRGSIVDENICQKSSSSSLATSDEECIKRQESYAEARARRQANLDAAIARARAKVRAGSRRHSDTAAVPVSKWDLGDFKIPKRVRTG